jgi:excinuclease ABC subunit C
MNKSLAAKLKALPIQPGVYFHKDKNGEIIYVGKAANLKNRVRQYFQASLSRDLKTSLLIADIADTDWMVVDSEIEALFLEAEMIRRYMPRYNILLRDDKSMVYIRIDYDSDYPTVSLTRRPLDDQARYFGPYLSAYNIKEALRRLRRIFPFAMTKSTSQNRPILQYYLGLDPGLETGRTSLSDYRKNLRQLIAYIRGNQKKVIKQLEREMNMAAKTKDFEQAAVIRNQLFAIQNLKKQVIFSDKEFLDISKDHALAELVKLLGLNQPPRRIEGYDISHMQGTDVVASMVVFVNGVSSKSQYRKFKTTIERNDDFSNMNEIINRRFSKNNLQAWGIPDLVLIDGGKGQLDAALRARDTRLYSEIPFIGLAKREEQIVIHSTLSKVQLDNKELEILGGYTKTTGQFVIINLPPRTNLIKLLQRIRDESHRFAISYHSTLKIKRQTTSSIESIPGIGPSTRKKLIKSFGSLKSLLETSETDIAKIIGAHKAKIIKSWLK